MKSRENPYLIILKFVKVMKRKFFMACAALVVSAATVVGVKAYNHSQLSDLAPKFPKEKTVNISSIGVELVLDSPNSMFYVDDCVIMQSTSANNKNVY